LAGGAGGAGVEEQTEVVSKLHSILRPFLLRRLKVDVEHRSASGRATRASANAPARASKRFCPNEGTSERAIAPERADERASDYARTSGRASEQLYPNERTSKRAIVARRTAWIGGADKIDELVERGARLADRKPNERSPVIKYDAYDCAVNAPSLPPKTETKLYIGMTEMQKFW
jgi:hypothetical protein